MLETALNAAQCPDTCQLGSPTNDAEREGESRFETMTRNSAVRQVASEDEVFETDGWHALLVQLKCFCGHESSQC